MVLIVRSLVRRPISRGCPRGARGARVWVAARRAASRCSCSLVWRSRRRPSAVEGSRPGQAPLGAQDEGGRLRPRAPAQEGQHLRPAGRGGLHHQQRLLGHHQALQAGQAALVHPEVDQAGQDVAHQPADGGQDDGHDQAQPGAGRGDEGGGEGGVDDQDGQGDGDAHEGAQHRRDVVIGDGDPAGLQVLDRRRPPELGAAHLAQGLQGGLVILVEGEDGRVCSSGHL